MQPPVTVVAQLPNGARIRIEAQQLGIAREVSDLEYRLGDIGQALEGIADTLWAPIRRIRPRKAEVEIGIDVAVESGRLTALLVKGSATANLKVTLSWEFGDAPPDSPGAAASRGAVTGGT